MRDPIDRAVRAIARRNSFALMWVQFGAAHIVLFGGIVLLRLYQAMSERHFIVLVLVSQALGAIDNLASIKLTRSMWRPVWEWERGHRDPESTVAAWQTLATFPLDYFRRTYRYPLLLGYLPFTAFTTVLLGLPVTSFLILAACGTSVLGCGLIVRYFAMEIVCRPVLEEVARALPDDFAIERTGLSLRWRLFGAAPVINVVTVLVVAGLATEGHQQKLTRLGLVWLLAVIVSLTISLELSVLVVRTLGSSMRDIQEAIRRVRDGDLHARVPVVATDEIGVLAQSFNQMVEGLEERETLREAFGAYVDPGVAERVLREGADLGGEEVEVTVLFLDVRDFTAFAERARPQEVVGRLAELWELVVPVLPRWGGHANKFVGDGLLAVFGAPDPLEDHAGRAVGAALEIVSCVADHYRGEVAVGIGVNTGRVIAGTIGGGGRVEFAVIGDTVNTAARVEAATRETGDAVLITEATRCKLSGERYEFEQRPPMPLKGKSVPVELWAPRLRAVAEDAQPASEGEASAVAP